MKKFILFSILILSCITMFAADSLSLISDSTKVIVPAIGTGNVINIDLNAWFLSFAALVAIVPFIVEAFKKLIGLTTPLVIQIFSWLIGVILTMVGWYFNLGFLTGVEWYIAFLYGVGVALASNGIFDTGLISAIIGFFVKKSIVNTTK